MKPDKKINLTAIVITRNEQENIGRCLEALKFCDEVLVVDDHSEDNTVDIAKQHGATVYIRDLTDSFSDQRNFGLSNARGKWVLFVDADEVISKQLKHEILNEIEKDVNYTAGYLFKRVDHIWGKSLKHGEVGDARFLRLAQRNAGKWHRRVHEHWHVVGQVKQFRNPILHYPHQTVGEFISEVNQRSTLHALANKEENKRSNILVIIAMPILKFIYGYLVRLGFLDGVAGFAVAVIMSLHSFMSWSKLWFLQKQIS